MQSTDWMFQSGEKDFGRIAAPQSILYSGSRPVESMVSLRFSLNQIGFDESCDKMLPSTCVVHVNELISMILPFSVPLMYSAWQSLKCINTP